MHGGIADLPATLRCSICLNLTQQTNAAHRRNIEMAFYTDTVASAPRTGFFAAIGSFFTSIAVAREASLNVQGRVAKMDEFNFFHHR